MATREKTWTGEAVKAYKMVSSILYTFIKKFLQKELGKDLVTEHAGFERKITNTRYKPDQLNSTDGVYVWLTIKYTFVLNVPIDTFNSKIGVPEIQAKINKAVGEKTKGGPFQTQVIASKYHNVVALQEDIEGKFVTILTFEVEVEGFLSMRGR